LIYLAPIVLVAYVYHAIRDLNEQAIDEHYAAYLKYLGSVSSTAAAYQQNYFVHAKRPTVAAGDFMMVCANMLFIAESEGQSPSAFDAQMTTMCRNSPSRIDKDFFEKAVQARSIN
jgi:hypothetical protein